MFCVARYVRCRHKVNVRRKVQQTSDVISRAESEGGKLSHLIVMPCLIQVTKLSRLSVDSLDLSHVPTCICIG